jgi:hypothetical protein
MPVYWNQYLINTVQVFRFCKPGIIAFYVYPFMSLDIELGKRPVNFRQTVTKLVI